MSGGRGTPGTSPPSAGRRCRGCAGCPSSPPAAAERVLQRPHRLQDAALALAPHYPFLGTLEGDETPPPDTATAQDTAPAPPAALAPSPDTAPPPGVPPPSDVSPPPAPTGPVPAEPPVSSPVPVEPPSAFPGGDGDTAVAGRWQRHEALAAARDEVVVPAEPGALRYLHRHYQDLLASIPEVSLLPLEGGDVSGFRVRRRLRVSPALRCRGGTALTARRSPAGERGAGPVPGGRRIPAEPAGHRGLAAGDAAVPRRGAVPAGRGRAERHPAAGESLPVRHRPGRRPLGPPGPTGTPRVTPRRALPPAQRR